jgi:hypothetical protein
MGGTRHWRARALVAVVLVLAPIAAGTALLFGGGQVKQCLGLTGCGLVPEPVQFPIIGTPAGALTVSVSLGAIWIVAAILATRYLWSADRTRLLRAAALTCVLVLATSVVVALSRLIDGDRLRVVAEDAGLFGLGDLIVALPLLLAWAVISTRGGTSSQPS